MKVAIPQWRRRISPVLDESRKLLLVQIENGLEVMRTEETLTHGDLLRRAHHISRLGVDVLICGAVSATLEIALASAGVQVISCKCGSVNDVIEAYIDNKIENSKFFMPGCGNQHRH